MNALTICSTEIRQLDGLYSLNDLHAASGGERKNEPSKFLRLDNIQELVNEIVHSPDLGSGIHSPDLGSGIHSSEMRSALKVINGGPQRGSYVCRELVYAYAMWISAKFHLAVIRAFDALVTQGRNFTSDNPFTQIDGPLLDRLGKLGRDVALCYLKTLGIPLPASAGNLNPTQDTADIVHGFQHRLQTLRHRLLTLHQDGERYTCDQAAPTAAFNPALATLGYLDPARALIGLTSTGFRRVCLPLDFRQVVTALHEHDLLLVESPSRHTLKWPQLPDIQRRAYLYTLPMSILTEQEAA